MSSTTDVAISTERAAVAPDKPVRIVQGKLRAALDAMVWEGLEWDAAAQSVEYAKQSMRKSLQRSEVLAYLRHEREVLRASIAPRNIHRLREIRDADNNMPAVNAIKVLEQLGDEQQSRGGSGASASPGVTIRVVNVIQSSPSAPHNILEQNVATEQDQ
jgi:hypothetical protein